MKKTILSTILVSSISLGANAYENHFYSFYDQDVKGNIDSMFLEVKKALDSKTFNTNIETHIVSSSRYETFYEITSDTLYVNTVDYPSIMHELGHQIFDVNVEAKVSMWKYFKVKQNIGFKDLEKTLAIFKGKRDKWKAINSSYARGEVQKLNGRIKKMESVLAFDNEYNDIVAKSNIFKRVTPYMEVFADMFSIYHFNDWNVIYNSAMKLTGNPVESEYRKFPLENKVSYDYKDPYSYYMKYKSYLRSVYKTPKDMNISCLFTAIAKSMEDDLLRTEFYTNDEANDDLIKNSKECVK